jgi:nucleoside-diphosphate-sugar epimerase
MALSTIAVTGRGDRTALLQNLSEHGYETVNVARGKQQTCLTPTSGQTSSTPGKPTGRSRRWVADAFVHLGTIPNPYGNQAYRTYESNTLSAMHVLEASESLGLESVCLASSINVMGAEHETRPPRVECLPIDEPHPRTPDDIYGIAKHAMEVTADGFGRRPDSNFTVSTSGIRGSRTTKRSSKASPTPTAR